jgi:hypothetical protein
VGARQHVAGRHESIGSTEYVITDSDECTLHNGGCSVNATCTNILGSRTCACNPGYRGDGVSCVESPATLTVTAPNDGEQWTAGTLQTITWTSSGVSSVDIHYQQTHASPAQPSRLPRRGAAGA